MLRYLFFLGSFLFVCGSFDVNAAEDKQGVSSPELTEAVSPDDADGKGEEKEKVGKISPEIFESLPVGLKIRGGFGAESKCYVINFPRNLLQNPLVAESIIPKCIADSFDPLDGYRVYVIQGASSENLEKILNLCHYSEQSWKMVFDQNSPKDLKVIEFFCRRLGFYTLGKRIHDYFRFKKMFIFGDASLVDKYTISEGYSVRKVILSSFKNSEVVGRLRRYSFFIDCESFSLHLPYIKDIYILKQEGVMETLSRNFYSQRVLFLSKISKMLGYSYKKYSDLFVIAEEWDGNNFIISCLLPPATESE